jgi:hypothetical protein
LAETGERETKSPRNGFRDDRRKDQQRLIGRLGFGGLSFQMPRERDGNAALGRDLQSLQILQKGA